ncbi:MAG: tetratricopeptide repeat protein [Candidatus Thorarchaeota archaeon]|jgi:tetratricopeptide (TPR) repeat protein
MLKRYPTTGGAISSSKISGICGNPAKDSSTRSVQGIYYIWLGWAIRMMSLGTITACFPYVDEETRNILQSVMDEAKDYDDFAERLCEKVLKDSVPELLIYFAYFHVYNQGKYNVLSKLMEAQVGSDFTKLFELMYDARRGGPVEWSDFQKAIAAALKVTDNDWIACHVYIAWREAAEFWFPEAETDIGPLEILEPKIMKDEEFSFFRSSLHKMKANRLSNENNIEEAKKWFDSAISLAKKHDDQEKLAILLYEKANMTKNVNFSEALSILEVQREVCERIGYVDGRTLNLHTLGHIAMAKGEYDAAIDYQNVVLRNREALGLPVGAMKCIIAFLYNQKGNGKRALELIIDGKEDLLQSAKVYCLVQESYALLNLQRDDEASQTLEKVRALSLTGGDEYMLGFTYLVEGLIEKNRHEFESASFTFEQAFRIFERSIGISYTNLALIHLTDVEIETYSYDKMETKTKYSGQWMQRLLKHVEQRELPGIAAQAMLLQAKFNFKQGDIAKSRKMLKKVLKTSEESSMHYIKELAESVIPDLFVS